MPLRNEAVVTNTELEYPKRVQRNGHTLELQGVMWKCLQCSHYFDAATDADGFWCGEDCTGRHL